MSCVLVPNVRPQQVSTTISEPATVKVEQLLKQADLVAVVQILSGDTEHYPSAVYKAEVLRSFKGTDNGAIIYFGPFISYRLGGEYVVFLHHSDKRIELKPQQTASGLSYGPISSFYLVMYEGYSALPVEYNCVFDGKEIAQHCDYGVKVNTYQVVLPKGLRTYPSATIGSFSENTRWVRKETFISLLLKLSN